MRRFPSSAWAKLVPSMLINLGSVHHKKVAIWPWSCLGSSLLSHSAVSEPKLFWTQLAATASVRLELAAGLGFISQH